MAIKNLSRDAFLKFVGFQNEDASEARWNTYHSFRDQLNETSRTYWDNKKNEIEQGIIYGGKFENYFRIFAKKILPYIHSNKTIEQLKCTKDEFAQKEFYNKKWNNKRWRFLFKLFFSKKIMALLGRDPVFLEQVKIPVGEFIFNKAETHLKSVHAQNNHILDFALTGRFDNTLPHYVQKENYGLIQKNIDRLVCHEGLIESAFEKFGTFDYFNLSNIFEYLSQTEFESIRTKLLEGANQHAKFAYWNLMVERKLSNNTNKLSALKLPTEFLQADKGFFYKDFHLEMKIA